MSKCALLIVALLAACVSIPPVHADQFSEIRYGGIPERDANGKIKRSAAVVSAFKKEHPCPVTGLITGPCTGWAIDHVIPLDCGGIDAVYNMQWLPDGIKSAAVIGKDRFERKIYGGHVTGTNCGIPPLK